MYEINKYNRVLGDHPKWAQWFDSDSIGGIFPLTGTSALQRAYRLVNYLFRIILVGRRFFLVVCCVRNHYEV